MKSLQNKVYVGVNTAKKRALSMDNHIIDRWGDLQWQLFRQLRLASGNSVNANEAPSRLRQRGWLDFASAIGEHFDDITSIKQK